METSVFGRQSPNIFEYGIMRDTVSPKPTTIYRSIQLHVHSVSIWPRETSLPGMLTTIQCFHERSSCVVRLGASGSTNAKRTIYGGNYFDRVLND